MGEEHRGVDLLHSGGAGRVSSEKSWEFCWTWPRTLLLTFERGDHAGAPLLKEALQLLPRPLQHSVVLDVAAQIPVVVLKQAVPGQATLLPVRTGHKHQHTL